MSQGSSKQNDAEQIVKSAKKELPTGKLFGHSLEKIQTSKDGIPKSIEVSFVLMHAAVACLVN